MSLATSLPAGASMSERPIAPATGTASAREGVAAGQCCGPTCCEDQHDTASRHGAARPAGAQGEVMLRSACAADLAAVQALLRDAHLPADDLAAQFGDQYAVAVGGDGAIVGAIGVECYGGDALLRSAVVAPAWQGQGLGEALTRDRLAWARTHRIRNLYLLTTTAVRFFPRFGFEPVERSSAPAALQASAEFASLCPSSAVTMRLRLPDGEESHHATAAGESLRMDVREKYGTAARQAVQGTLASCGCRAAGDAGASAGTWNPITSGLYEAGETEGIPTRALLASLGCGNPAALAQLAPGEVVLDLGSGGGIDVLLSAKRVGPTGKAYGLDMTEAMLALARENQRAAGVDNVEFLRGEIEHIPLPDASVDVIISNCVINLSADKRQVLREAFRVLKPGGRFAVSDVVVRGAVPDDVRRNVELWLGCVAGAPEQGEFELLLRDAGFESPSVEPTRIYRLEDARALLAEAGLDADALAPQVDGRFMSAFVRATKPAR